MSQTSPDAQRLSGVKYFFRGAEGTRASVAGFRNRAGAGIAVTPEEVVLRGGIADV